MRALGAREMLPLCEGDVDGGDLDGVFDLWSGKLLAALEGKEGNSPSSVLENGGVSESESESFGGSEDDESDADEESGVVDLEDIAGKGPSRNSANKGLNSKSAVKPLASMNGEEKGVKEMVTPIIRTNLEKQVSLSVVHLGYLFAGMVFKIDSGNLGFAVEYTDILIQFFFPLNYNFCSSIFQNRMHL